MPCVLQFAGGSPLGALCGRGDWDPSSPRLYGCYDTKVTTWSLAQRLEADAGELCCLQNRGLFLLLYGRCGSMGAGVPGGGRGGRAQRAVQPHCPPASSLYPCALAAQSSAPRTALARRLLLGAAPVLWQKQVLAGLGGGEWTSCATSDPAGTRGSIPAHVTNPVTLRS